MPNKNIGCHCQQAPQVLTLWHVRKQADGTVFIPLFCFNNHLAVGSVSSDVYNTNSENVVSNHTEQALFSQQYFMPSSAFLENEVKHWMFYQNV